MKKLLSLAAALLLALGSGCAHSGKNTKLRLYADKSETGLHGYHNVAGTGILENKNYRISVKQVLEGSELGQPRLINDLLKKEYVVLRIEMENRSDKKMIFNPAHAVLTTDAFDYKKPLEYTDFYELSSGKDDSAREREAQAMKGLFYDLTLTLKSRAKTSRMLIFPPLSKNSEKADLLIKDLYVGTDTTELFFPFVLEEE